MLLPVRSNEGPNPFHRVRNTTIAVAVLFRGKWRVQIFCALRSGSVRLGQLARLIPEAASKKMLMQNLRQLEACGIIVRKDMSDLVLHVEYDLAVQTRESVCVLLDHLADWGRLLSCEATNR